MMTEDKYTLFLKQFPILKALFLYIYIRVLRKYTACSSMVLNTLHVLEQLFRFHKWFQVSGHSPRAGRMFQNNDEPFSGTLFMVQNVLFQKAGETNQNVRDQSEGILIFRFLINDSKFHSKTLTLHTSILSMFLNNRILIQNTSNVFTDLEEQFSILQNPLVNHLTCVCWCFSLPGGNSVL